MSTTTSNIGLTLPTPNVDSGWGSTLNTDFTLIDNLFAANGSGTSVGVNVGAGKTANVGGTLVAGGTVILGSGDGTGTVAAPTIRGAARTGNNIVGGNLVIDALNGTGTGGSGAIVFRTAPADPGGGTTANTMRAVLTIASNGDITANVGTFVNGSGTPLGSSVTGINTQSGTSYTLVLGDAGKLVEMNNASANTVTVPPNGSVAFPTGTIINLSSIGTGQTTIVAGSGVTLRSYGSKLKLTGQYSQAALIKRATNEWAVAGDLIA